MVGHSLRIEVAEVVVLNLQHWPSLSAKVGSDLTRDVDKLCRWAKNFAEIHNCGVNDSEALPVILSLPKKNSNDEVDDEELTVCLSVRGENCCCHLIAEDGSAPGLDEV